MEFQFKNHQDDSRLVIKSIAKETILDRSTSGSRRKFVGVRQRPSGKWVAEIKNTTQKIRMWLGTFDTAVEAAQAYDEAACLLRGSNTRKNFMNHFPCNPALALKIRNILNQKKTINRSKGINKVSSKAPMNSSVISPSPSLAQSNIVRNNTCNPQATISCNSTCSYLSSPTGSTSTNSIDSIEDEIFSYETNIEGATSLFTKENGDMELFDEAYKPDMSFFMLGSEKGLSNFDSLSSFTTDFDRILEAEPDTSCHDATRIEQTPVPDFEHMKVERQISTSLYAMNGVSEYWENLHACNSSFWDLPMVSPMFRPSF